MTESDHHAKAICRHLDLGVERVSFRVQSRLEDARQRALRNLPAVADGPPSVVPQFANLAPAGSRPARPPSSRTPARRPSLWWRLGVTATPALLLIAGLVVGDAIQQDQSAEELAEVDSALLTDEVPLMAYADHGFGVYLRNTRR